MCVRVGVHGCVCKCVSVCECMCVREREGEYQQESAVKSCDDISMGPRIILSQRFSKDGDGFEIQLERKEVKSGINGTMGMSLLDVSGCFNVQLSFSQFVLS